ncbi:MAG: hypothetical protein HY720_05210 [Planctomycetes bacterium]|nr:hypothetical protein [Planctomycetota bacterium]
MLAPIVGSLVAEIVYPWLAKEEPMQPAAQSDSPRGYLPVLRGDGLSSPSQSGFGARPWTTAKPRGPTAVPAPAGAIEPDLSAEESSDGHRPLAHVSPDPARIGEGTESCDQYLMGT